MEKYKVGVIGATGMVGQRLITLLEGRALRPLTDAEFTRGAVSLVLAWCGRAVRGEYASLVDLTGDLQSLMKIYQSYKS